MADKKRSTIDPAVFHRKIDRLTLFNDYFMRRFFSHAIEETELVLEILLRSADADGHNVGAVHVSRVNGVHLEDVSTEAVLKTLYEHESRLDILAKDNNGKLYDIEFQVKPKQAGFRRARFYSSMLDTQALNVGCDYSELPDVYVIFLTLNDVIGSGNPIDVFSVFHHQDGAKANFGMYYIYVNCSLIDDTDLGRLKHDFQCSDSAQMYYEKLGRRMDFIKSSIKEDPQMLSIMEEFRQEGLEEGLLIGREEGEEKGRKEGEEKGRKEGEEKGRKEGEEKGRKEEKSKIIQEMLLDGMSEVLIAKYTCSSEEEIACVRRRLKLC